MSYPIFWPKVPLTRVARPWSVFDFLVKNSAKRYFKIPHIWFRVRPSSLFILILFIFNFHLIFLRRFYFIYSNFNLYFLSFYFLLRTLFFFTFTLYPFCLFFVQNNIRACYAFLICNTNPGTNSRPNPQSSTSFCSSQQTLTHDSCPINRTCITQKQGNRIVQQQIHKPLKIRIDSDCHINQ